MELKRGNRYNVAAAADLFFFSFLLSKSRRRARKWHHLPKLVPHQQEAKKKCVFSHEIILFLYLQKIVFYFLTHLFKLKRRQIHPHWNTKKNKQKTINYQCLKQKIIIIIISIIIVTYTHARCIKDKSAHTIVYIIITTGFH